MKRVTKQLLRMERLEDRKMLSVAPVAPTITAPPPRTSIETAPSTFTFSFIDANTSDTHAAAVDWGDGTPFTHLDSVSSPFTVHHNYESVGTYQPRLWVTDSTNRTDIETFTMKVYPKPSSKLQGPVIETVGDRTAIAGATASLDFEFTDPNNNDRFRAAIDWGDGTELVQIDSVDRNFTLEHTFTRPGTFRPKLWVTDSTNRTGIEQFSMTIYPQPSTNPQLRPPVIATQVDRTSIARITRDFEFHFDTANGGNTFDAAIDWGDGSPLQQLENVTSPIIVSRAFNDDGVYSPKLWVTGATGLSDSAEFTMTVFQNPGPTLRVTGSQTGYIRETTFINLVIEDETLTDEYSVIVHWGDSDQNNVHNDHNRYPPTQAGVFQIDHVYNFPGTYQVRAEVFEGRYFHEIIFPITIVPSPNAVVITSAEAPSTASYGGRVRFDLEFEDDNPDDTHRVVLCQDELFGFSHSWISSPRASTRGLEYVCVEQRTTEHNVTFNVWEAGGFPGVLRPQVWIFNEDGAATYTKFDEIPLERGPAEPRIFGLPGCNAMPGNTATCGVYFTDANDDDTHVTSIDWGDGVVESALGGEHTYAESGTYWVTMSVVDSSGLEDSIVRRVEIFDEPDE